MGPPTSSLQAAVLSPGPEGLSHDEPLGSAWLSTVLSLNGLMGAVTTCWRAPPQRDGHFPVGALVPTIRLTGGAGPLAFYRGGLTLQGLRCQVGAVRRGLGYAAHPGQGSGPPVTLWLQVQAAPGGFLPSSHFLVPPWSQLGPVSSSPPAQVGYWGILYTCLLWPRCRPEASWGGLRTNTYENSWKISLSKRKRNPDSVIKNHTQKNPPTPKLSLSFMRVDGGSS